MIIDYILTEVSQDYVYYGQDLEDVPCHDHGCDLWDEGNLN